MPNVLSVEYLFLPLLKITEWWEIKIETALPLTTKFDAQSFITKLTEDTEVTQVTDEETQVAVDSIDLEVSKYPSPMKCSILKSELSELNVEIDNYSIPLCKNSRFWKVTQF